MRGTDVAQGNFGPATAVEQPDDQEALVTRLVARIAELEQLLYAQHLDKEVEVCRCGVKCRDSALEDDKSFLLQQLSSLPAYWGELDKVDFFGPGRCPTPASSSC